jgi:UDPglucose 6-dehydrogenase
MKIVILGAGYVGLVSSACFAEFGATVTCIDVDEQRVDSLSDGVIPIYEPGLEDLVKRNVQQGKLCFSTDMAEAISAADLLFIAVGTPTRRGDGHADLSYVYRAAEDVAKYLDGYTVVVDKSTVPVGTARQVARIISETNPAADFDVASNPEFLREGSAIEDFMRPDRVVIGVESKRAEELLRELYRPLNLIEAPVMVTDLESAELIKYASNAFLATKISFINEMSLLCEKVGADVHAVAKGMGLDNRIGKKFLHAGPGYGGSCFPKDTQALIRIAQENDASCRIVEAAAEVNAAQKARMVSKIRTALGGSETGKVIAILGLTFKPETDDMRDAPSLAILPALLDKGAIIQAHDPEGMSSARDLLPPGVVYREDATATLEGADAVVLMTEWNQYRGLDLKAAQTKMRGKVFVDLRNVYEPDEMKNAGFDYHCVGRQT